MKHGKAGGIAGIRLRVVLLILITQAIMVYWVADSEIVGGIYLICYSLMMPTVLYLLAARILRRWLPFEDRELLIGYIVLTATIPIIGFGGLRFIVEGMGYLQYFSEKQPQWLKYLPFVGKLPVLQDQAAAQGLYMGEMPVPWRAWTVPIAFWSTYLLALSGIWICLAGLLRRVWVNQERLSFPVAMMPLQVMDKRDDIFRKPLFWIGFAIPAVLQSLLAIHDWMPSVPAIQMKAFNAAPLLFSSPPWNAIRDLNVGFFPMAVGLAYFVPSNISFSCWFFAILVRLFCVVSAVFGVDPAGTKASRFPYYEEQASGAWIAFAALMLWRARGHVRSTVTKSTSQAERDAIRRLWIGAGACTALCGVMMYLAGIPTFMAGPVILVYAAYVLTGARVRAEAGGMWTFAPLWSPHDAVQAVSGTGGLTPGAVTSTGYFDLVHVDIRGQSLPYLMEGMDIADKSGIPWRTVLIWVGIGSVTALALGWWSTLSTLYDVGAATAQANPYPINKATIAFNKVDRLVTNSQPIDPAGIWAMAFGAVFTVVLTLAGRGLMGLNPIGYILANTMTMKSFIVPFFIAWLAKTLVLRYGGNRLYRRSVPLFVGIVLGDVVTQALWALVGQVFRVPIYQFLT